MTLGGRLAAATVPVLVLAGCASPAAGPGADTELRVFAAASLSGAFPVLGRDFEAAHPGVRVTFSFDGSATLVDQLSAGAAADVLATADEQTMDRATAAGLVAGTPQPFTSNELTLIVPPGNPAGVTGLDASLEGVKLVACAAGVPCGAATRRLAERARVTLRTVSEETRVTDVRAKVESGQADAGIVYVTDALASQDRVETIPIPGAGEARNGYLIGVPVSAARADLGAAFVELVRGRRGQHVLGAAGFGEA